MKKRARTIAVKKPKRLPPMPGEEGAELRYCAGCQYELPLAYFGIPAKKLTTCHVCRDERKDAKPWTFEDTMALRHAVSRALDLWPKYFDMWDEEDLVLLRGLLDAAGRDG